MYPLQSRWTTIAVVVMMGALCLGIRSDTVTAASPGLSAQMKLLPGRTLWAWERPEDLRAIDPRTTAIAYLDRTILLGPDAISQKRHQPLIYPSSASLIAVVRIEAPRDAKLGTVQEQQAVAFLLKSAEVPGVAALQVDFDATRSQRTFYTNLLTDLRRRMPINLPLSITALASWCSNNDRIAGKMRSRAGWASQG
jgi:hypothetical protein